MDKPNIVMLVADQLNFRHLGCMGNGVCRTPHIDALASEGALFENAYCQAPLCMPSRASFNTGVYPHACRVRHNPVVLPADVPTLAQRLGDAGHQCGGFGHIGGDGVERGFARKIDFCDEPLRTAYMREQEHVLRDGGRPVHHCGPHPFPAEQTFDGLTCSAALDFLADASQPFYTQVNFMRPHIPLLVPQPFCSAYDPADIPLPPTVRDGLEGKPSNLRATRVATGMESLPEGQLRESLAHYYAAVSFIDALVGKLVNQLRDMGCLDETLIIFTADHGDYAGEFGLIGKTGQFYESLVHVPLIMRGPVAGIPAGKRIDGLASLVDLVPTVLDACKIQSSDQLQGETRLPLARGATQDSARAAFASTSATGRGAPRSFNEEWKIPLVPLATDPYSSGPCSHVMDGTMIRSGKYKLCHWLDGSLELYDLEADPWEQRNLAKDPSLRETALSLVAEMLRWQMRTWLPDTPQSPVPYHFRAAWPGSLAPKRAEQKREREAGSSRTASDVTGDGVPKEG